MHVRTQPHCLANATRHDCRDAIPGAPRWLGFLAALGLAILAPACDGLGDEGAPGSAAGAMEIYGIDLIITDSSGPSSAAPWSSFDARATICNQGTDWSSGFEVVVVLSDDGTLDPHGPHNLGSEMIDSLSSGECRTLDILSHINAPDGQYTLGFVVDPWDYISEADESNNTAGDATLVVGNDPDLWIASLEGPPSARSWDPLEATVKICNQGQSSTWGGDVHVMLSLDTEITEGDDMVGSAPLPSLMPGQCSDVTVTGSVNVSDGAYYLAAMVDMWNSIPELLEDNNHAVGELTGIGDGPDLVITTITAPAGVEPWNPIDARIEICNRGTTSASYGHVDFYLSDDEIITDDDEHAGGTGLAELPPGHCSDREVQFYNHAESGTFTLGAIAVLSGMESELIASNNTTAGGEIVVGSAPDLVITEVSGPHSIRSWENFEARVTVCNHGTADSDGVDITVYTSPDAQITTNDDHAGNAYIPQLIRGQCTSLPVNGWVSGTGSSTYLGAIVDAYNNTLELVETNNTLAGTRIGVGDDPDIVVAEVSGPASISSSGELETSVKVCNHGTTQAQNVDVELLLSSDDIIDPDGTSDHHAGHVWLPWLDPGECVSAVTEYWVYVSEGTYRLAAVADPYNSTQELIDSNNTTLGGFITSAP